MNTTAPTTFAIRAEDGYTVSRAQLLALAEELGLMHDDRVMVTVMGDELRITLTPLGEQALQEVGTR